MEWLERAHRLKDKVKVKLSLYLTTTLRHEDVWGSGRIDPHFLDLGTGWSWVVRFTPLPLYLRGKSPWYPFDWRLGGPQSRSGRLTEERVLHLMRTRNSDPSVVQPVASRHTDWALPARIYTRIQLKSKRFKSSAKSLWGLVAGAKASGVWYRTFRTLTHLLHHQVLFYF
jgi:hypothetical protein